MSKLMDSLQSSASNGVGLLLNEIRKHQPDMPPEVRDDMTFGAVVVLYEISLARAGRIKMLERWMFALSGGLAGITLTVFALHSDAPWLVGLLKAVFE